MRDSEVKHLQRGCVKVWRDENGRITASPALPNAAARIKIARKRCDRTAGMAPAECVAHVPGSKPDLPSSTV
ncbi:hypothetical protein [Streptomyces sp. NPDC058861]|uniref:hypothetical protein n=1 Tax=Streptomyces sp. NPDC058861 TaxID=3346653 RepID=UPI00369AE255